VKITFDPKKREATLKDRRLDFADAPQIFAGRTFDILTSGTITEKRALSPSAICVIAWSFWCGLRAARADTSFR
jgi:uncharacterized DUF497 family protein